MPSWGSNTNTEDRLRFDTARDPDGIEVRAVVGHSDVKHRRIMNQACSVYLVTYEKREPLISQIDILNIFRRVCRSAALPVLYTEGFNPQPHLSFGPALPLGVSGLNEMMYLRLTERMEPGEVVRLLSGSLPPAVRVISVSIVEGKAHSLNSLSSGADYACYIPFGAEDLLAERFFPGVQPPVFSNTRFLGTQAVGTQAAGSASTRRVIDPTGMEGAPKGLDSLCLDIEDGQAVLRVFIRAVGGNVSSPLGILRAAAGERFGDFIWKVVRVRLHFDVIPSGGPAEA